MNKKKTTFNAHLSEDAKKKVGISPDGETQRILVEGQYLNLLYVVQVDYSWVCVYVLNVWARYLWR